VWTSQPNQQPQALNGGKEQLHQFIPPPPFRPHKLLTHYFLSSQALPPSLPLNYIISWPHSTPLATHLKRWTGWGLGKSHSTHSHIAVPLASPRTSSSSLPGEKYATLNRIFTNCQENIIDIHSCLCRGLHEEKAIFVSITLSFVMFHHPFICQICFITRKCNNNIWWCLPLKFFHPCLCSPKCILNRQLQFN